MTMTIAPDFHPSPPARGSVDRTAPCDAERHHDGTVSPGDVHHRGVEMLCVGESR